MIMSLSLGLEAAIKIVSVANVSSDILFLPSTNKLLLRSRK